MRPSETRLAHQRELAEAAAALGEWLEHAGDHQDEVPAETWRKIAEASASVTAAAMALAAEVGEVRDD